MKLVRMKNAEACSQCQAPGMCQRARELGQDRERDAEGQLVELQALDDNSTASCCLHLKSRTLPPAISQPQEDRTMGLTEDKGTDVQPDKAFPEESLD